MLKRVGFEWLHTHGGLDFAEFDAEHKRMLIVARKQQ
jgi:hypothetical protein